MQYPNNRGSKIFPFAVKQESNLLVFDLSFQIKKQPYLESTFSFFRSPSDVYISFKILLNLPTHSNCCNAIDQPEFVSKPS